MGFDSQAAFGRALGGFSVNRVSRAERGENPIPTEMLIALAKQGINANYLLTGEGSVWIGKEAERQREVTPQEIEDVIEILRQIQGGLSRNPPLPQDVLEEVRKNRGEKT